MNLLVTAALTVGALGLGLAAGVVLVSRLLGLSRNAIRLVAIGFAVLGLGFSAVTFFYRAGAGNALFEGLLTGAAEARFSVRHPEAGHILYFVPVMRRGKTARTPARVAVEVVGPGGDRLLSLEETFLPHQGIWKPGRIARFTPLRKGLHTLRARPLTANIPRIYVQVGEEPPP